MTFNSMEPSDANQLESTRATAKQAMREIAELNEILSAIQQINEGEDLRECANGVLNALSKLGLNSSIKLYKDRNNPTFLSHDNQTNDAESEFIDIARQTGTVVQLEARVLLNFPHCSLLIRNMPVDDAEFYGRLKSQLSLVVALLNEKIDFALQGEGNQRKQKQINSTGAVLSKMIHEMEMNNVNFNNAFKSSLRQLDTAFGASKASTALTESEQKARQESSDAIKSLKEVFEKRLELEKVYSSIMSRLVASLE